MTKQGGVDQEPVVRTSPNRRLFLERSGYAQRRIIDAARLLPILGLFLWLIPLIWPAAGDDGAIKTSSGTIYIFAVWYALIGCGAYLALRIVPTEDSQLPSEEDDMDLHQRPVGFSKDVRDR